MANDVIDLENLKQTFKECVAGIQSAGQKDIPEYERYYIYATIFKIPVGYVHINDRDRLIEALEQAGVTKHEFRRGYESN